MQKKNSTKTLRIILVVIILAAALVLIWQQKKAPVSAMPGLNPGAQGYTPPTSPPPASQ